LQYMSRLTAENDVKVQKNIKVFSANKFAVRTLITVWMLNRCEIANMAKLSRATGIVIFGVSFWG